MKIVRIMARLQDFYLLAVVTPVVALKKPYYVREILEQMDYAGPGSFFITLLVAFFIGMALSLQTSAELAVIGFDLYTGKIVGLSVIKEIGPVAVALAFAGRVGSGMTSELASMSLGHQLDVLTVFGVNLAKKLVAPRIFASIVMLPVLTIIGDCVAIIGGYLIAVFTFHQSGPLYWNQIKALLTPENLVTGTVKPLIFGYMIAAISCYMGISTKHGGAKGLRTATTDAVVLSIVAIIATDFILGRVLLLMFRSI
jgi:phospholipid/cholesterol/gamma-HCH transport system permease protein